MTNEHFSRNLRRLRQEKGLTQEQLANRLGVSVQSVSRWECATTLPDVMLLPELARLYGVTVDDLYREDARGYPSYAQRLLAVYETSGRSEDFLAAEQEFARLNEPTADDLRAWGVLYHYMMSNSARLAQQKLEQAMSHPKATEQVYLSAAQQRILLLCGQGRGAEEVRRYAEALEHSPGDRRLWLLAVAAMEFHGEPERALETALEGLERFPNDASLMIHAGDVCRTLKRYEQAFSWWQRALETDSSHLDAVYSTGFCHEELGNWEKAHRVWTELTRKLDSRGQVIERAFPASRAEICMRKMGEIIET